MRMARIKLLGRGAVYHCVSRVVGRQRLLDDACKEMLVQLLWKLTAFYGLEVVTYCMLDNHFHLLLRASPQGEMDDSAILERLTAFYGSQGTLPTVARQGLSERGQIDADVRKHLLGRMGDLSVFMQEFKQRFSRWYNRHHQRDGTLWSERFCSVIIEDQPASVEAVAAYIDLNPVRAGLVADPKEYRFCGYAAAVAGNRLARKGLMSIQKGAHSASAAPYNPANAAVTSRVDSRVANASWEAATAKKISPLQSSPELTSEAKIAPTPSAPNSAAPIPVTPVATYKSVPTLATQGSPAPEIKPWTAWSVCASEYRMHLFSRAGTTHQSGKTTLNPEKIREVLQQGGHLSLGEICRLRLRHFTAGLALGTQEFVNEVFTLHREKFSPNRNVGALLYPPFTSIGLSILRSLRRRAT